MNKREFLEILREKLSILDENELEDILSEYEQHIDMKAAGAMTEEAAIADFGDIDELVGDILQAYHVRADFAGEKKKDGAGTENWMEKTEHRIGKFFHDCFQWLAEAFGEIGQSVREWAEKCADFCRRLFADRKTEEKTEPLKAAPKKDKMQEFSVKRIPQKEKKEKMEKKSGNTFLSGLAGMCRGCAAAFVWCVKVLWNLFIGGTGVVMGFGSSVCLFFLGTLVVLLAQGYPLVGITIGFFGLTLCALSVTAFCFTLIVRKRKEEKKHSEEQTGNATEEEMINA